MSTCNRTELYLSLPDGQSADPGAWLCEAAGVSGAEFTDAFVIRRGTDCARHLMEVACGLCSQILGEDQILTQVKTAVTLARQGKSLLLTVANTAQTLSKELLENMFDRFYRGDKARSSEQGAMASACPSPRHAPTPCSHARRQQALTRHLPNRNQATEQADAAPLPAAEGTWTPPSCQAIGIILLIQPRLHRPRDVCGGRN